MSEISTLFKAAHNIRFHLAELVSSEEAKTLDAQLVELLAKTESGEEVHQQLRTLLQSNKQTKEWVGKFLKEESTKERGFSDLPGIDSTSIPPDRYSCPEPNCTYTWFRRTLGQAVPQCPEHHRQLIPKK